MGPITQEFSLAFEVAVRAVGGLGVVVALIGMVLALLPLLCLALDNATQSEREQAFLLGEVTKFAGCRDNTASGTPHLAGAAAPPSGCAPVAAHGYTPFAMIGMCCEGYAVRASCEGCPNLPPAKPAFGALA